MVFLVTHECRCCKLFLWHCKRCWDKYHNGKRDKDYISPKYLHQPMSEEVAEELEKIYGIKSRARFNKDIKYKEGMYGH